MPLVDEPLEVAQPGREAERERDHVDATGDADRPRRPARFASGWLMARGFSQRTCLPAATAAAGHGAVQVARRADHDRVDVGVRRRARPRCRGPGERPTARRRPWPLPRPGRRPRSPRRAPAGAAGSAGGRSRRCGPLRSGRLGSDARSCARSPDDGRIASPLPRPVVHRGSRRRRRLARFRRPQKAGTIAASRALIRNMAGSAGEEESWPTTWRTSTGSSCRSAR